MTTKVKKEPLKTRSPRKYYHRAYVGCQVGEWGAIATPIIAIFAAKWNEYFDFVENQGESIRLTIGCVLAIVCAIFFGYKKLKNQEKQEKKVTMLSYVFGIAVAWAAVFLFKVIIDDLFLILSCELAGAGAAYGIDFATQYNLKKYNLYQGAYEKLDAEEAATREREERRRRAVE